MKSTVLGRNAVAGAALALFAVSASALEINAVKKPPRATPKADLIVYLVDQDYGPANNIRVTIRNIGKATSDSGVLSAENLGPGGGQGEATIPALAPNAVKNIDVKLSQAPRKGNRIKLFADSKNHVDESNENNNLKFINY